MLLRCHCVLPRVPERRSSLHTSTSGSSNCDTHESMAGLRGCEGPYLFFDRAYRPVEQQSSLPHSGYVARIHVKTRGFLRPTSVIGGACMHLLYALIFTHMFSEASGNGVAAVASFPTSGIRMRTIGSKAKLTRGICHFGSFMSVTRTRT